MAFSISRKVGKALKRYTDRSGLPHAFALRSRRGAPEAAHLGPLRASAATLERLDLPGRPLEDGEEIEAGEVRLRALATPGHSGDHLCYWARASGDVFTGDLVLSEGSSMVAWPDGSVADYLASLERLAALSPSRLLPGHGPPVGNAVEKLHEYASHRAERTKQVIAALDAPRSRPASSGPRSSPSLLTLSTQPR